MDEPTSALSSGEVKHLFQIMNELKARGLGIIFISHKLDELFAICDRMSVIRDGHYIGMRNKKLAGLADSGEYLDYIAHYVDYEQIFIRFGFYSLEASVDYVEYEWIS